LTKLAARFTNPKLDYCSLYQKSKTILVSALESYAAASLSSSICVASSLVPLSCDINMAFPFSYVCACKVFMILLRHFTLVLSVDFS